MDLHQLYIFTKVVEHKSFSKAAEDIYLSQSTVSSHIQSLEKTLKVPLFDRVGRESILTPSGERLYGWALKLLQLKDRTLLDLSQGMTDLKGDIRIAASSVPSEFMVPKMIKKFRHEYKNVIFHINQASSKTVAEKVLSGSVDLGIIGEKYDYDRLQYVSLIQEKLVLISPKQLEFKSPIRIKDVLKYPFIMRNSDSGTNSFIERYLKANKIKKERMNIVAYVDSSQSLVQFVKEGIGISIVSEMVSKEYVNRDGIHMYEIEDLDHERNFYLVYNINRTLSVIAKKFIEEAAHLVEKIEQ